MQQDSGSSDALVVSGVASRSSLPSPTMELQGHQQPVYCMGFDPSGKILASGSKDRNIFLWETYDKCSNFAVLSGHKSSILDLCWATDGAAIYSSSADKTAAVWDAERREKRRALKGHDDFVYSVACARRGPELVLTACEDGEARLWDVRSGGRRPAMSVQHSMPCLAVEFSDDASSFYTGCLDEAVRQWDLRKATGGGAAGGPEPTPSMELHGHARMVTDLALSPDGKTLLSNSSDGTLRAWDTRPFAVLGRRCQRQFAGASHGRGMQLLGCSWSPDGLRVASGSADGNCVVWEYESEQSLAAAATSTAALIAVVQAGGGGGASSSSSSSSSSQSSVPIADAGMVAAQVEGSLTGAPPLMRLPGHKGTVYRCEFSPTEPVVASCSEDGSVLLGELPALGGSGAGGGGEEEEDGIVAPSAASGAGGD